MASKASAFYQYETSPRKLEPEYKPKKNKNNSKKNKTQVKKTNLQTKKEKHLDSRNMKAKFIAYLILLALPFLIITYRNSQIDESFMKVKSLQADLALLQKENEQLKVSIENSFNLSALEQQTKELLGMQKLENFQKEYITLPKKDFVEPVSEKILKVEDNWYQKLIKIVTNLW